MVKALVRLRTSEGLDEAMAGEVLPSLSTLAQSSQIMARSLPPIMNAQTIGKFLVSTLRLLLIAAFPACIIHAQAPTGTPSRNFPFNATSAESEGRNLFTNGNFEKGTAGWGLNNWGKNARMEVDKNERHEGKPSLRVENREGCHSFISQIVKGRPNTHYRMSGYVKTKDVAPGEPGKESGAILMVGRMGVHTELLAGTQPWTKVTTEFTTNDSGEIRAGPSLGTDFNSAAGTAWFSELRLVEVHSQVAK